MASIAISSPAFGIVRPALRADLVAAVAVVVALDPNASWAIAFRDSLNPDALMQVVLQGIDNNAKKATGDEAPAASVAPNGGGKSR